MITRSSIAFEDFLGSSIAPQVMPPWSHVIKVMQVIQMRHGMKVVLAMQGSQEMQVIQVSLAHLWVNFWVIATASLSGWFVSEKYCHNKYIMIILL